MMSPNSGTKGRLRLQYEATNGSLSAIDIILIGDSSLSVDPPKNGGLTSPNLFQHLPVHIPQARCLVYEHDLSPSSLVTSAIGDEAENLLQALENWREATSSVSQISRLSTRKGHQLPWSIRTT